MRLQLLFASFLLLPAIAGAEHSDADYAAHLEALRARLPGEGFTIVLQKPFVVIGDEAPATVRRRAVGTVKWAVDRLKAKYFEKDPEAIVDVWLFKDERSYRTHVKTLFGSEPDTKFGYYTSAHDALVMNISTGGGTLVHEIVHPFMSANFPGCPSWFNEGLASLYEQCGDRDGEITGFTNWRLRGLQEALRGDGVPSFKQLTATSRYAFYNEDRGTNYAQARYLCYFLQQRGLLVKFYRRFRETSKADPTGYAALQHVLGTEDLTVFQEQTWEPFVLELEFR